jgi:hypothetical protein
MTWFPQVLTGTMREKDRAETLRAPGWPDAPGSDE